MTDVVTRYARDTDFTAIVALNLAEVKYTSPMDEGRLRSIDAIASYHKVVTVDGEVAAFLLAMREGCGYVNENFEWFSVRFEAFLYVDRIVVSSNYKQLRLGTLLYKDMFNWAKSGGITLIACEYNTVPPNQPSRIFHDKFGFREVGSRWLDIGAKQVSLQVAKP